jgi:sulfate adenylyltransferase
MTGVGDPYEDPTDAEVVLDTSNLPVDAAVGAVLGYLADHGWIEPPA